ncbi:MAG: hypothetical protein ACR2FO_05300 [Actinomycetota bacterium]
MASTIEGAEPEFTERLNTLLSSAIREKARDERVLAETVSSVGESLDKFAEDLATVKKLVARPYQPLLTMLSSKLTEVEGLVTQIREEIADRQIASADALEGRLTEETGNLSKFIEDWGKFFDGRLAQESQRIRRLQERTTERTGQAMQTQADSVAVGLNSVKEEVHFHLTNAEEALRADVEAAQEAIFDQINESAETTSEVLEQVTQVVHTQVGVGVAAAIAPLSEQLERVAQQVSEAGRRISEANGRLEALQGSLVAYLTERDERLESVRDQAMIDLVERMSENISGRSKAKVSGALQKVARSRKDGRSGGKDKSSRAGDESDSFF